MNLLGVAELAELLGVSRQRASELRYRKDFPAPVALLECGPIWDKDQIVSFERTWRRQPGRPSKVNA